MGEGWGGVKSSYCKESKLVATCQACRCLRADVSYFLCCTRKRDPFPRATKEIGDVCTQASLSGRAIALGSEPPLVTRIARTGLSARLLLGKEKDKRRL